MFYDVEVSRISTANKVIRVEADSPEDAEKKALAAAGDEDFAGCTTDYEFECSGVAPVTDPSVPPFSMNIAHSKSREADNLTDAKGRNLSREDVEELAMEKIVASGEGSMGAAWMPTSRTWTTAPSSSGRRTMTAISPTGCSSRRRAPYAGRSCRRSRRRSTKDGCPVSGTARRSAAVRSAPTALQSISTPSTRASNSSSRN